jgi:sec-independent protein translocase protein TatA
MFENLTLPHILMVLVIVLLLFGAKRIPEIAGSMGKGIKEFKKNIQEGANDSSAASRADPGPLSSGRDPGPLSSGREPGTRVEEEPRKEPKRLL